MRTLTATEASRRFSDLLDAVERGESVAITRGNRRIAEIGPAHSSTGRALREAIESLEPLDDAFEADVDAARKLLRDEWIDPWADG